MAKVHTYKNGRGDLEQCVSLRIEFALSMHEMVDGLCSKYIRHGLEELPESLTQAQIIAAVKEQYAYYGTAAVWTWCENGAHYMTDEEAQAWAERLIVAAFPEMGEHRG